MSQPYLGQIAVFAFDFAPSGWALCNGQTLAISANTALFSLLGTFYGGNGVNTFQLPNLQGCAAIGAGQGPGLPSFVLGEIGGEVNHTLQLSELPVHMHTMAAATAPANETAAAGNFLTSLETDAFSTAGANAVLGNGLAPAGGSQPHTNMQPNLTVNFCIALTGVFPSRS